MFLAQIFDKKGFSDLCCDIVTTVSSQIRAVRPTEKSASASNFTRQSAAPKSAKSANQHIPVAPGQPQTSRQPLSAAPNQHQLPASNHQVAAPNQHQLPAPTTRQQHQNQHQLPVSPPGSSTKSASASSFHHQAAAPHQPAPARQPANQLLTLLPYHTHIMAARSVV